MQRLFLKKSGLGFIDLTYTGWVTNPGPCLPSELVVQSCISSPGCLKGG